MLIRLQENVLDLNPSAIVMLLGTNDIEVGIDPEAIGRNFQKIVQAIKARHPKVPLVLCRIFPSSAEKKRPAETIRRVTDSRRNYVMLGRTYGCRYSLVNS